MPLELHLTAAAEAHLAEVLACSGGRRGDLRRRRYQTLIFTALQELAADPARHIILARLIGSALYVLAIVHDSMEDELNRRISTGGAAGWGDQGQGACAAVCASAGVRRMVVRSRDYNAMVTIGSGNELRQFG